MISVYLIEGCGKTYARINDTMPHTWIVWVYAQSVHSRIAIQEMSAVRYPIALKTVRFSIQDCENTFVKYVRRKSSTDIHYFDITNLRKFSETNNTPRGHCSCRIQRNHPPPMSEG